MAGRRRVDNKKRRVAIAVTLIAIVVVLVIALLTVYFVRPQLFDALRDLLGGKGDGSGNQGNDGSSQNDGSGNQGDGSGDGLTPGLSDGTLNMTVVDVGQGDCIFTVLPDGKTMLMDAGTELGKASREDDIKQVIDGFGIKAIDYLFITHSDYDHIRYLGALLAKYEFKKIYMPRVARDMSATWTKTVEAIESETYTDGDAKVPAERIYNIGAYTVEGEAWRMRCFSYSEEDYQIGRASCRERV